MRVAFLECFAGIAGDMFVAAAVDAGVPFEVLSEAVAALQLDVVLRLEKVDRSGIFSSRFQVLVHGQPAESAEQTHLHEHSHEHEHPLAHHSHKHEHAHGRSLAQIRSLIAAAPLDQPIRERATRIFELLGAAEAKIHNVPVDTIHFHEVGSLDAIVDIVAASAAIDYLERSGPLQWHVSAINVGGGMAECAHGTFPVPAPATAELLCGLPTYSAHLQKELATPTGAAILHSLAPRTAPPPPTAFTSIGYGAGTRNPKGFPNVLRLSLGEAFLESASGSEDVVVLETALDDLNPQILAHTAELALAQGALDLMLTPVLMKKGRPGTLLTLLARPADAARMEAMLFRETSTLGLRVRREARRTLDRRHESVHTAYGPIRVKLGLLHGEVVNAAPEFEDCRAAAANHNVPLKLVYQAAIAAWRQRQEDFAGTESIAGSGQGIGHGNAKGSGQ